MAGQGKVGRNNEGQGLEAVDRLVDAGDSNGDLHPA